MARNKDSESDGIVRHVAPFLTVSNMERSVRYYVNGLGFTMKHKWVVEGKLRWRWAVLR
jgi:lactoylglutathione lyase